MEKLFNSISNTLSKCEEIIKGLAVITIMLSYLELIIGTVCAVVMAIGAKDIKVFGSIFIWIIGSFFAADILCLFIYSWGEKIEHTKKQTELLKIVAMNKE